MCGLMSVLHCSSSERGSRRSQRGDSHSPGHKRRRETPSPRSLRHRSSRYVSLSHSRAGLTSESSRAGWGLCIDYSLPFQVSVNLFWGIPPYPKFWSHRTCPLSPQQSRGRRSLSALPTNPGSILGEGSLLSLPLFFFSLFCEMLISVSFSWFTCFGGFGVGGNENGSCGRGGYSLGLPGLDSERIWEALSPF